MRAALAAIALVGAACCGAFELPSNCPGFCKCMASEMLKCATGSLPDKPDLENGVFVYQADRSGEVMYLRFNRGSDAWEYTPAGPEADEWLAVTESESYLKAWAAATFKDSGRKQHASTAVLSDADAGLLAFLAKYHPHPGALGGGSMCTIKLPDAYSMMRSCYTRVNVLEGSCATHRCSRALARSADHMLRTMAKAAVSTNDASVARGRQLLAADLLSLDPSLLPTMQLVEAGLLWDSGEQQRAAWALLSAVPVVGLWPFSVNAYGSLNPVLGNLQRLLTLPQTADLMEEVAQGALSYGAFGPEEASKAVTEAVPFLPRVYRGLRHVRESGPKLKTMLRRHDWQGAATVIEDLRRHLSRDDDICKLGNTTSLLRPLVQSFLTLSRQFSLINWISEDHAETGMLALQCMCKLEPYPRHANWLELRNCARQIAILVYKIDAGEPEKKAVAGVAFRSASSSRDMLHGPNVDPEMAAILDLNFQDKSEMEAQVRADLYGKPVARKPKDVVSPRMVGTLIPKLNDEMEAELVRLQERSFDAEGLKEVFSEDVSVDEALFRIEDPVPEPEAREATVKPASEPDSGSGAGGEEGGDGASEKRAEESVGDSVSAEEWAFIPPEKLRAMLKEVIAKSDGQAREETKKERVREREARAAEDEAIQDAMFGEAASER